MNHSHKEAKLRPSAPECRAVASACESLDHFSYSHLHRRNKQSLVLLQLSVLLLSSNEICIFMLHTIFNGVCDKKYEDIWVRLNFLTLHSRRRHLHTLFLFMFLKPKLVAHLFLILLACVYPLGLSDTTLHLLYIVTSVSVPQPDVFLLPMQSVGALTSLTKFVFSLLISFRFLNQNNCSLF
jgi:hypothetical protein